MRIVATLNNKIVATVESQTPEQLQEFASNNPALTCYLSSTTGPVTGKLYDAATDMLTDDPDYVDPVNPVIDGVPQQVDALQGLLAIDEAGLSATYQAWADAPERTFVERAFINKAMTWKRDDPTLMAAATALGLTSEQVDTLFIAASKK